ncbi:hypothetical protein AOL_s00076g509 [Orbilia oligospora ATCC 24927]|uniref:Glycosyltransferase family 92 protein n=1 Tax=Arthrobotrys oligospora (strain ATCC 24927 / CBS 115.81 / DSM 1491) TaxID=756982 RepID=G1XA51_ARTOA|nr:hypothetical protein AOL_s00076g509 [Orbilia oligospora ATCC 24927]EGX49868.1 hypothetical protein AOL_s00076g509 [Orbilia oligospora ATCC 24927]
MNTASTAFRLLVLLCVLVMILLSLLSFTFISPRKTLHATPINLTAPSLKPTDPMYLAACVPMSKDLATLPEFILHHYAHIGIQRFYLVDQSEEGGVSNHYHELPLNASYITWLGTPPATDNETAQFAAYNACQSRYGSLHAWIAYLDVDEFIEQKRKDVTLQNFLHSMDKNATVGALGINMLLHTNNSHILKPEGTLRAAFTECVSSDMEKSPNAHIKSIVKTKYYEKPRTDHNFITKSESLTVGEKGDKVPFIFRRPITTDLFAIHHYAIRSREQFNVRVKNGEVEEPRTFPNMMDWWDAVGKMPKMKCDSMAKLKP